MSDAIDRYLDQLATKTLYRRVDSNRLRSDAEEHLRDVQAELIGAGVGVADAAEIAVERFGDPRSVALAAPRRGGPLVAQIARTSWPLLGVGLVAIGIGGLVALAVARLTGHEIGTAVTLAQISAGFVGVSILESRWRRGLSRTQATPGLSARFAPLLAVFAFAVATVSLVTYGILLLTWDRHHHSATALSTAGMLGLTAIYYVVRLIDIHRDQSLKRPGVRSFG